MNKAIPVLSMMFVAVLVAPAACSASADDGGTPHGAGADSGTGGAGGGLLLGGGGPSGCLECSADLKTVLDCDGNVVQECGGDQACLAGVCGDDPCGAAEAAKSSYGCDYWAVKPDLISAAFGACFGAYVANTWSVPVHIDVSRDGQDLGHAFIVIPQGQGQTLTYEPYDPAAGLPVGEVAIVF